MQNEKNVYYLLFLQYLKWKSAILDYYNSNKFQVDTYSCSVYSGLRLKKISKFSPDSQNNQISS